MFNSDREGSLSIPYRAILDVAYGPEVVFPSDDKQISYPWSRYFHRSLPYLTITFEDSTGVEETAVFELGSNIVRPTLDALQTRSRRQVQLQTIVACCMYKTPEECGWAPLIELKGRKKVFVDAASTNVKNRERIIEELTKARLGVELQTVAADAEVILHFDGEFGLWFPGSRRTDLTSGRATGEAYVVHEGRLRTIMVFDERWSDWKNRAAVFARKFVEAYRKAHDVK